MDDEMRDSLINELTEYMEKMSTINFSDFDFFAEKYTLERENLRQLLYVIDDKLGNKFGRKTIDFIVTKFFYISIKMVLLINFKRFKFIESLSGFQ